MWCIPLVYSVKNKFQSECFTSLIIVTSHCFFLDAPGLDGSGAAEGLQEFVGRDEEKDGDGGWRREGAPP